MGNTVICIDDIFTESQHEVFSKYGITLPKKGEEYTIRDTLNTQNGPAYLLVEVVNPKIPNGIPDPEGTDFFFEPCWATWRFIDSVNYMENILELKYETNH